MLFLGHLWTAQELGSYSMYYAVVCLCPQTSNKYYCTHLSKVEVVDCSCSWKLRLAPHQHHALHVTSTSDRERSVVSGYLCVETCGLVTILCNLISWSTF